MMGLSEVLSIVTVCAAVASAVSATGLAIATRRYAGGTLALAVATRDGVASQAAASRDLVETNREIASASMRSQIISTTRLAWMDSVRDAIAEFLSLDEQIKSAAHAQLSKETFQNLWQRRLGTRHRIEFRLDPDKTMHTVLLATIDDLLAAPMHDPTLVESVRRLTVTTMEEEWRRVRRELGAAVSADTKA